MRWKTKTFSLLLTGQGISLLGNSMLDLALSMYVLEVTGSAALFAAFLLPPWYQPFFGPSRWCVGRQGKSQSHDGGIGPCLRNSHAACHSAGRPWHDLPVLCATLILLSILGAFETPVAQACLPLLLQGESLVRGNAAVNQVSAVSSLAGPFSGEPRL